MTPPPLYRQLSEQLRQWITPKDQRHLTGFSEILGAILMSESACMSRWLPYLSHRNCEGRSHLERSSYFLRNPHITAEQFYVPLLEHLLQNWAGGAMTLALDTSMQWDEFCLIQITLVWGGRSIPIAHTVLKHGSATVGFEQYRPVLEQAKARLPKGVTVTLLADRGFEHGELIRWARRANWYWAIRAKSDLLITTIPDQPPVPVASLLPPISETHLYSDVTILGDIQCHLATATLPKAKESWAVIGELPEGSDFFTVYGKRFGGIEPYFKDYKSSAFDITDSRLRDEKALSRLFMMLSTATLLSISLGFWLCKNQERTKVDAHTNRGLSFLQLGLRQIQRLRHLQLPLSPFRALTYENPPPAYASRRKEKHETRPFPFAFTALYHPETQVLSIS
jgi:Transposase DDE domain